MKLGTIALAVVALLGFTSAAGARPPNNPYFGSWKVVSSIQAPWYNGNGALPTVDPELDGKTILFEKTRASGSRVVECAKPVYSLSNVERASLFEGGLKNPEKDGAALGFTNDTILSMNESCDTSDGDMELDFPMVDKDTTLLGINNRIYTLKRVAPAN